MPLYLITVSVGLTLFVLGRRVITTNTRLLRPVVVSQSYPSGHKRQQTREPNRKK
jgi:hypothetical protein